MPRSVRKQLLNLAEQSLHAIDGLDTRLQVMDELHEGRQPALTAMAPMLVDGHEAIRALWRALKAEL